MSFVAVDLGASGTRYVSDAGQISILPNNVAFLPDGVQSLITPDAADIESCLEVQIAKTEGGANDFFPVNVIMGIMAERSTEVNERPSVIEAKYKQRINYTSAIVAAALSKLKFSGLDDAIDLYLAVPPAQIVEARKVFNETLVGKYVVAFPKYMNGTTVEVNIASVSVYEESFMALTSFFFNMNGTVKESAKPYMTGTILSLDIGASTSDLSVTKNGRFLDKSGQTYTYGGNEARGAMADGVRSRYNIDLPIEDADKSMAEGRLQLGNTYDDISDIVSEAKMSLAKKLTNNMQTYFGKIGVPINTVNAIVVSGGGSMQSQYVNGDGEIVKTSEPMSYFVTQELTKWSKGTVVVPYGDDARFANVKGLFIRAKLDAIKKAQAKTAQTVQNAQQSNGAVGGNGAVASVQTPVQPVQTQSNGAVATHVQNTAAIQGAGAVGAGAQTIGAAVASTN